VNNKIEDSPMSFLLVPGKYLRLITKNNLSRIFSFYSSGIAYKLCAARFSSERGQYSLLEIILVRVYFIA